MPPAPLLRPLRLAVVTNHGKVSAGHRSPVGLDGGGPVYQSDYGHTDPNARQWQARAQQDCAEGPPGVRFYRTHDGVMQEELGSQRSFPGTRSTGFSTGSALIGSVG